VAYIRIYRHPKRPEWGMAVAREQRDDCMLFIFEDAQVRAFKSHLLNVLEVVELPEAEAAAVHAKLNKKRVPGAAARKKAKASSAQAALPSFDRQLGIFLHEFPLGFSDTRYMQEERGSGTDRNALIARAQTQLTSRTFERKIAEDDCAPLYETARALTRTLSDSLAGSTKPERPLNRDGQNTFVRALQQLLHGDAPYESRFDAWVSAMGVDAKATWPAATYLQALVHPTKQIFVKRSFWCAQASILSMEESSQATPRGAAYSHFSGVAQALNERLERAGHKPQDLWDTHSFVWRTLGPRQSFREA
jgi:hypothetical protein